MHVNIQIDNSTTKEQLVALSEAMAVFSRGFPTLEEVMKSPAVQKSMQSGLIGLGNGPVPVPQTVAAVAQSAEVQQTGEASHTAVEGDEAQPKKRRRTPKADPSELEPPEAGEQVSQPERLVEVQPQPAATTALVAQDVRDALKAFVEANGMDGATAKLNELGFRMVSEIPDDKFAWVIAQLKV